MISNELIDRNYQAIIDRKLIIPKTSWREFMKKADEERLELYKAFFESDGKFDDHVKEELADCITVFLNMATHFKIDLEEILTKNAEKNESRSKNM